MTARSRFTWEDRGDGFTYAVTPDGALGSERVDEPTFDAFVECIEVEVIADSGLDLGAHERVRVNLRTFGDLSVLCEPAGTLYPFRVAR